MSQATPTNIELRQKSRVLSIAFSDGEQFELPCEYLRVFSRAAEHLVLKEPVVGKEQVNIINIEPQGSYGLRLYFDDGHDTAIYSFETLHDLGMNQTENWRAYLSRLEELGYQRGEAQQGEINVTVILFAWLARLLDSDEESVTLGSGAHCVSDALAILREKPGRWAEFLGEEDVEVEINEQPATIYSPLANLDELVVIPKSGTAPA